MENDSLSFGEYVKQRREQLGKTMRSFASEIGISPAYLCDIENGNRKPPERFLEKIAVSLEIFDSEEQNNFYDLAGISKNGQHSDINTYMDDLPSARMAMRTARDRNFTDEDWLEIVRIIKQKNQN